MTLRHATALPAWLVYTIVLGALYVRIPPTPDQSLFDYIGWVASEGGTLYVDVADQNWPGKMWLHQASTSLFGNHLWSYRLLDYLLMLGSCAVLAGLCHAGGAPVAGYIVVPLYQVMYVTANGWLVGHRDIIAAHLLLAAGLAFTWRIRGGSRVSLVVAAACIGYAVLTRPTYLLFAPLLFLCDVLLKSNSQRTLRTILHDAVCCGAAMLGFLGVPALLAWGSGALSEWYTIAFRFNLEVYSRDQPPGVVTDQLWQLLRHQWHWYCLFAVAGGVLWWRAKPARVSAGILGAVLLTCLASAYWQGKGFGYHFGGLLPVLAALSARFISSVAAGPGSRRRLPEWCLAIIVCTITVTGVASKVRGALGPQARWYAGRESTHSLLSRYPLGTGYSMAESVDAAEYIGQTVPPGHTVLVWDRGAYINFLARRRSPTRFITCGMLTLPHASFSGMPGWSNEIANTLEIRPPELILLPRATQQAWETTGARTSEPESELRQQLRRNYGFECSFGNLDVFRRCGRNTTRHAASTIQAPVGSFRSSAPRGNDFFVSTSGTTDAPLPAPRSPFEANSDSRRLTDRAQH